MEQLKKTPWAEAELTEQPAQRDEKGRFVAGSKAAGRPLGSGNGTTKEIRQIFINIVQDHLEQVYLDLKALSPKDRIAAIAALSQLIMPRLSAIAIGHGEEDGGRRMTTIIDWSEPSLQVAHTEKNVNEG